VETRESSPGALNRLLVMALRGCALLPEPKWGAITTVPVRTPTAVLAAFDANDDRPLVENAAHRELTQGYRLPTCIGKAASAMAAHVCVGVRLYRVVAR
jgi:hypothetical protein